MLSDLEIVQKSKMKPIKKVARKIGVSDKYLEVYGRYKAKISLSVLDKIKKRSQGKYILVTAMTPTPLGEGKTTITIGLSMALNKFKKTIACIRQPSLGPVFGIKGGAAGGGYSQVIPMEDFNLHFTGDTHAVGLAHNLAAAFLDNHILKGNKLKINPESISWRRVMDVSDRSLRNIKVSLNGTDNKIICETGFDITAASEVMTILALSDSLKDLRMRIGSIVLASDVNGKPITTEDIKVAGAMTALLKDAIKPNLIQTLENTPCFVHTGPFANIAHGNSSILSDKIALGLADYVITEAGFGADCGAEKFFDIKCRQSGLIPNAVVVVCSIRALKIHSGRFQVLAGKPLEKGLLEENLDAVKEGFCNLEKHIENIRSFGLPVVVAINRFNTDTQKEIDFIVRKSKEAGASDCVVSDLWAKGSRGGLGLAKAVLKTAEEKGNFEFLYPLDISIKEKIRTVATKVYGAKDVEYTQEAEEQIKKFTRMGYDKLSICMTKTHFSLSHDPRLKGKPQDFILPINSVRIYAGAGFLSPICGKIQTMPGLPSKPAGERVDINEDGKVKGLF